MAKTAIAPTLFSPAMPVSLVGAQVDGKPNFMAVAWVSRVNFDPPMLAVAIGAGHHTPRGIRESKTFSVCIPGVSLVDKADYCGLVSGARVDKSGLFRVFYGQAETAPMIEECPLCAECLVAKVVDLPSNLLFIGTIVAVHADESVLVDGKPDPAKVDPLLLTMPDNQYRKVGGAVAKAWSVGKALKK